MAEKELLDVKLDAVGKAAEKYMEKKGQYAAILKEVQSSEKALIDELHKAKRQSISLKGETLRVKVVASKEKIVKAGRRK